MYDNNENNNQNVFGNNDLRPIQQFNSKNFQEYLDKSQERQVKKKKSFLAFVGEVVVYILLLPIITSYYFIYFRADITRDFFIDDVPISVKIVAWSLWILIGILFGYYKFLTNQG